MNITLGTNNIANILRGLHRGFEQLGHRVQTVVKEPSLYYDDTGFNTIYRRWDHVRPKIALLNRIKEKTDYSRQHRKMDRQLAATLNETDLYVFLWSSFRPQLADLELLRKNNKKIISFFAGSEVRYSNAFAHEFNVDMSSWEEGLRKDDLNEKLYHTRMAEYYSDCIFSVPDQSGLMVRDYNHFFLPVDLQQISYRTDTNEIPKIVHAPTRTGAKGTELFVAVVEKLKAEGLKFEFEFFRNLKHRQLIGLLEETDILLDELYFHGPGMLAAEAMAAGCVVVTKTLGSNTSIFNPPVVSVTPENLYEKLKKIIIDREYRMQVKDLSRKYVTEKNDCKLVCAQIMEKLHSGKTDYLPTYFTDAFDPQDKKLVNDTNKKMTEKVLGKFGKISAGQKQRMREKGLI